MADVDSILARWGAMSSAPRSLADAGKLLGISLGLGAIFNEDQAAEKAWMNTYNERLGGVPIRQVLAGHIDDVLAQVDAERGLR